MRRNLPEDRPDIKEAREEDKRKKEKMQPYKHTYGDTIDQKIQKEDDVLLKRKTTKQDSIYDPDSYKVTTIYGTQVRAIREGQEKTRDAQKWKRIQVSKNNSYAEFVKGSSYRNDPDIGASDT